MIVNHRQILWPALGLAAVLLLAGCAGTPTAPAAVSPQPTAPPEPSDTAAPPEEAYRIVTVLPRDAIQAINDPELYDALSADLEYTPDEMVLGVKVEGEARAYSLDVLAQREIVNDTVGGHPLAVTY